MGFIDSFWGIMVIGWAPYIGLGGVALYLGGRYARALERRNAGRGELVEIQDRLLRLEESVADVSRDIERVAEGQSFTTRVLADRGRPAEVPREGSF